MSDEDLGALIAAAAAYEELHVPAIFLEWVGPVLDAAGVETGQRVLDVACGTGILTRAAYARVGRNGSVAGVDPGAGMLAVAERLAPSIEWTPGTAEALPFPDDSFDAVVSQFGLMFFTDRAAAVREMVRVLRPGGRLAVAVWDALERTPAYATEVSLLEEMAGEAAAEALRAPFVLGEPAALRSLLESAGLESVVVDTRTGTARFPSLRSMVEADMRGWLPMMGVHLADGEIAAILDAAEVRMSDYVADDGRAIFDSPGHIASGTKA